MEKTTIKHQNKKIEVEVADNPITRAWGLSLRENGKMLFKFPRETKSKVDMMLISKPLHLYFLNSEKKVVNTQKAEPWTFNPKTWKLYSPQQKYRYLLESFKPLKIQEKDQLKF